MEMILLIKLTEMGLILSIQRAVFFLISQVFTVTSLHLKYHKIPFPSLFYLFPIFSFTEASKPFNQKGFCNVTNTHRHTHIKLHINE